MTSYSSTVAFGLVIPVSSGVALFVYPGVLVINGRVGVTGARGRA